MSNVLEIKHAWFYYNQAPVLEDIVLSMPKNSFLGILGPNGAGKTTLIKLIIGLLTPQEGSVRIFGKPPAQVGEKIGYVPQQIAYDFTFPISVADVVLSGLLTPRKIFKPYTRHDLTAAHQALETVHMQNFFSHQMSDLSGGQRQRVLLARALVSKPSLLVLDEPLSNVDICLEFAFYDLLHSLKEKMSIILVSHDIGVMSHHVDRIACLNRTLTLHDDKEKALHQLEKVYGCPVDIIAHGVPHRILREHGHG